MGNGGYDLFLGDDDGSVGNICQSVSKYVFSIYAVYCVPIILQKAVKMLMGI